MQMQFEGFYPQTIDIFMGLRLNCNDKPWFDENKEQFKQYCKLPFELFAKEMTGHVWQYMPQIPLNVHVSRIYKDMRHYTGGARYNDHLWTSCKYAGDEWQDRPVYWFGLGPDGYDYGMGYFRNSRQTLEALRAKIDANPAEFKDKVVNTMAKQNSFKLSGEKYKRRVADYPEDISEWYHSKDLYIIHKSPLGKELFNRDILEQVKHDFDLVRPIYEYLWSLHIDTL